MCSYTEWYMLEGNDHYDKKVINYQIRISSWFIIIDIMYV